MESQTVAPSVSPPLATSQTSVKELAALVQRARVQVEKIEALQAKIEPEQKSLQEIQEKISFVMKESELEKFAVPGYGTYFLKQNFSVKTPKEEADRNAFFDYLREHGIFETMVTVNSATLNAWYKQEIEVAAEKGIIDFKVPGINEPSVYATLQFRKETKRG